MVRADVPRCTSGATLPSPPAIQDSSQYFQGDRQVVRHLCATRTARTQVADRECAVIVDHIIIIIISGYRISGAHHIWPESAPHGLQCWQPAKSGEKVPTLLVDGVDGISTSTVSVEDMKDSREDIGQLNTRIVGEELSLSHPVLGTVLSQQDDHRKSGDTEQ